MGAQIQNPALIVIKIPADRHTLQVIHHELQLNQVIIVGIIVLQEAIQLTLNQITIRVRILDQLIQNQEVILVQDRDLHIQNQVATLVQDLDQPIQNLLIQGQVAIINLLVTQGREVLTQNLATQDQVHLVQDQALPGQDQMYLNQVVPDRVVRVQEVVHLDQEALVQVEVREDVGNNCKI